MKIILFLHTIFAFSITLGCAAEDKKTKELIAIAYVEGKEGQIKGNVTFVQNACDGPVTIYISVTGLKIGPHGFHIHEKGDLTNGCTSMGGHYNPNKMDHGGPDDDVRHIGDLGNICVDQNGEVDSTKTDNVISLNGARSIIGRGLVIHADADDLGHGDNPDSKKTGNAGARVACGVIGISSPSKRDWVCSKAADIITKYTFFIILSLAIIIALAH